MLKLCPPLRTLLDLTPSEMTLEPPPAEGQAAVNACLAALKSQLTGGGDNGYHTAADARRALDESFRAAGQESFAEQVFLVHLEAKAPQVRVMAPMIGCIRYLCGQNPAKAVMWAHAVAAYCARTGDPDHKVVPFFGPGLKFGLPTDAGMHALWREQKIDRDTLRQIRETDRSALDNWLDQKSAWAPDVLAPQPASVH